MFRSKAWKWLLLGSAITIIVLYMAELTTSGIERVYGPLESSQSAQRQALEAGLAGEEKNTRGLIPITDNERYEEVAAVEVKSERPSLSTGSPVDQEIATLEAEIAELKRQALLKEKQELQKKLLINEEASKPAVNRMADSTSEVLQKTSSGSIEFIAKLFSNVIN